MRYDRLEDLIRLALRMQGRADGLSLDDIRDEFAVSRRTAERMRDALVRSFPQIEELGDLGRRKRWRLPPASVGRMAEPTLDDLAALGRGADLAAREGDTVTAARLTALSDKLRASLTAARRRRIEPDISALLEADGVAFRPGPREAIPVEVLSCLREALLAGVWIEIDHRARASGKLSRSARLGPLAVLFGEGRQYLVAWSDYQEDIRLFALTGIERIALTNEPFERPEGFDLTEYLSGSFGVYREAAHDVVWRFAPDAAAAAAHYRFHPGQSMEREADGSLVVRFRSGGVREMAWHLFRWGDAVEIVAPEALRAEYEGMLRAGLTATGENAEK
jgi:predicted DNA-binding transcriptional regulator YafY